MRVLFVSTYDAHGGAARAAYRLYTGVKQLAEARLVVKSSTGDDPAVVTAVAKQATYWEKRVHQLATLLGVREPRPALPPQLSALPPAIDSADLAREIKAFQPDIVHLHWICSDFLSLEDISTLGRPVLWTLHDSWPFTGACHVPGACLRYRESCGACPQLTHAQEQWSRKLHRLKRSCYAGMDLTVVAPSRWLAGAARSSSLLGKSRVEVIPNGLDLSRYRPFDKMMAREVLGLPKDRPLLLFGGMSSTTDPNKGFDLLLKALATPAGAGNGAALAVFGASGGAVPDHFSMPVHFLGTLRDDTTLALLYSAADVMVVPSRQEAFCQTASEAMACGVPVVCFATTGLLDVVEHGVDGYAATPFDPADLARGIVWALEPSRSGELSRKARAKAVAKFSSGVVAARYHELYRQMLS